MKLLYLFVIIALLQPVHAGDPLEQLLGKNVKFETPLGGIPSIWVGTVIGVSYPFVEIQYQNGEVHCLNYALIDEVVGGLPNMTRLEDL